MHKNHIVVVIQYQNPFSIDVPSIKNKIYALAKRESIQLVKVGYASKHI